MSRRIAYLVRFVGRHNEAHVQKIAKALAAQYQHSSGDSRYRYVVFAQEPNAHYAGKGVTYITFREAIGFLVEVRGQCWIEANIGVASVHPQWDNLLKRIFEIANDTRLGQPERVIEIERLLGS